jgi:hypothetical protein
MILVYNIITKTLTEKIDKECIDGFSFMRIQERQWIETIGLEFLQFYLLETIILGWKFGSSRIQPTSIIKDISMCQGSINSLI